MVLNARLRNVPGTEMGDTARYRYTYELTKEEQSQGTLAEYMVRFVDQISHQKTWVGRYDWMILPSSIRTLIGPKTDIPQGVNLIGQMQPSSTGTENTACQLMYMPYRRARIWSRLRDKISWMKSPLSS